MNFYTSLITEPAFVQSLWRAQMLLLLSQAFVWLLETLRRDDAVVYLRALKEPVWLMTGCCLFATLVPQVMIFMEGETQALFALVCAIIWALMFVGDMVQEWSEVNGNVRALAVGHCVLSVLNSVVCLIWWNQ